MDKNINGLLTLQRTKNKGPEEKNATALSDEELRQTDDGEHEKEDEYRLHRRFDRMGRLVGDDAMNSLRKADVMVIGQGGVGSWCSEALVRSGVGRVRLVDFDLVCVTNGNRQLHAMRGTTGKSKVAVMAERLKKINPSAVIEDFQTFYSKDNADELFAEPPDLVVDAIDNLNAKTHLIAECKKREIALVVSGGASGRLDPTQIRESDLTEVVGDPFLATTRKLLRKHYSFPKADAGRWGIRTIHSLEEAAMPRELDYDNGEGFRCVCPQGSNGLHSCDKRNLIYGTAGFVTGAFGLACSAAAVRMIVSGQAGKQPSPPLASK